MYAHRMTTTRSHAPIVDVLAAAGIRTIPLSPHSQPPSHSRSRLSHEDEDAWMDARRHSLKRIRVKREKRRDAYGRQNAHEEPVMEGDEGEEEDVQELGYDSDSGDGSASGSYGSSTGLALGGGNGNGNENAHAHPPRIPIVERAVSRPYGQQYTQPQQQQQPHRDVVKAQKPTSFRVANPDHERRLGGHRDLRPKTSRPLNGAVIPTSNMNMNTNGNVNVIGSGVGRRWDDHGRDRDRERDSAAFVEAYSATSGGSSAKTKMSDSYRLAHDVVQYSFGSR